MPAEFKKNNPRPSRGGAGMDNEVGALVVGLPEYKKNSTPSIRGVGMGGVVVCLPNLKKQPQTLERRGGHGE